MFDIFVLYLVPRPYDYLDYIIYTVKFRIPFPLCLVEGPIVW